MTRGARCCLETLEYFAHGSGVCWPEQKTLARFAGCSLRSIKTHLEQLRGAGLIRSEQRPNTSCRYFLDCKETALPIVKKLHSRTPSCTPSISITEVKTKATTEAASFPLTLAAIQERFPMDRAGVQRLVAACPGVTDADLAEAVCIATKPYQESAGLYLHTIPPLLEFWRARRKPPAHETCGLCLGTGSVHEGPAPAWELPDSDPAWTAWDATERACGCQNGRMETAKGYGTGA